MAEPLKRISGVAFYLLGGSLFMAYLLHVNMLGGAWPMWWLHVADLPTAFAACVYGGTSFFLSVASPGHTSRVLPIVLSSVLTLVFLSVLTLNFWDVLR